MNQSTKVLIMHSVSTDNMQGTVTMLSLRFRFEIGGKLTGAATACSPLNLVVNFGRRCQWQRVRLGARSANQFRFRVTGFRLIVQFTAGFLNHLNTFGTCRGVQG